MLEFLIRISILREYVVHCYQKNLRYEKDKEAAEKQFRTEAAKHFEKAFGKGSCWKVFGTHYPSSTGYAEFINQITALIKKWNVVDQGNEILKDFHGYR